MMKLIIIISILLIVVICPPVVLLLEVWHLIPFLIALFITPPALEKLPFPQA